MSKSDFGRVDGFVVDHLVPDVVLAAIDDKLVISIQANNSVTFSHMPYATGAVSRWHQATGTYHETADRIDGSVPHSSNPADGVHPFSMTLDRGPRGSHNRPRIHVYIGPRPMGGTPDDGEWTGGGGPPPP